MFQGNLIPVILLPEFQFLVVSELETYKMTSASMSNVLTFVLTESRAVTGPCTAEYEPLTAGKKKMRAMQRVARIVKSKPSWREVVNRMPRQFL
jgi:hypothetical protein